MFILLSNKQIFSIQNKIIFRGASDIGLELNGFVSRG